MKNITILLLAFSPILAQADPAYDSGLVINCLDTIRNQYVPASEAFDSCVESPTPGGRIDCLHRLARPLSDKSQCTSNPGNQVPAMAVDGVSIDVPTSVDAVSVCQMIGDGMSRRACEQEVRGRAFAGTEMNICRSLPDNSQILKCMMAVQGGCFDDRVAVEICGTIASAPPPVAPTVVYSSPPPTVVIEPQPVYYTTPVYYSSPRVVVVPSPIWVHPLPGPWNWHHHWRRL